MNPKSIASKVHWSIYGKSDNANAAENATEEFQAGYRAAAAAEGTGKDDLILKEWQRRGSPMAQDENFCEWKRGMWAYRLQRAEAKGMTA